MYPIRTRTEDSRTAVSRRTCKPLHHKTTDMGVSPDGLNTTLPTPKSAWFLTRYTLSVFTLVSVFA